MGASSHWVTGQQATSAACGVHLALALLSDFACALIAAYRHPSEELLLCCMA